MKQFFVLAGIAIVLLSQLGCSSDEEQTKLENPAVIDETAAFSGAPLLGDVVLENMYEDEARNLTDKTPVQIVTVLEGTNRVTLEAQYRGVRDFGFGFPLYEFELTDKLGDEIGGIAQGMSGSPVGPPGRIMGALSYGDSFAATPYRFWATSIDAMEDAITHQTFGEMFEAERAAAAPGGIQAAYTPVKTPLMISGIQPNRLEQLSSHLEGSHFDFVQLFADIGDAPAAPPTTTTRLAAGDMIGVAVSTGDVVNSIGFGTVTQVYDDGTFVAFGHPMIGAGKSALPVYRAVTNGIVHNLQIPYKIFISLRESNRDNHQRPKTRSCGRTWYGAINDSGEDCLPSRQRSRSREESQGGLRSGIVPADRCSCYDGFHPSGNKFSNSGRDCHAPIQRDRNRLHRIFSKYIFGSVFRYVVKH